MDFIKGILIFFVFLIFVKIGSLYSKKYISRESQLEQMKNLLNIFKVKIKFTCNTIQEIFNQLYEDTPNEVGGIFKKANDYMETYSAKEAWSESLEEAKTDFTKEDIETLKNLGKILGETDVEGQINQIELTETLLENQIKEAIEERAKNSKMYRTLGVTIGLAISIILIWEGSKEYGHKSFI